MKSNVFMSMHIFLVVFLLTGCMEMAADDSAYSKEHATSVGVNTNLTSEEDTSPTATCAGGVWSGDYTARSQADLDLLARYTQVTGNLQIASTELTSMTGPACLEAVGGTLRFTENRYLARIDGFDQLETIGGSLRFEYNGSGLVVDGFDDLYSVGGDVRNDGQSATFQGFARLERIDGRIIGTEASLYITGMNDLSTLGGMGFVECNRIYLDGLTDLEQVLGSIDFNTNGTVSPAGLINLSTIGGSLIFRDSRVDEAGLAGFLGLRHIGGSLVIDMNGRITHLDAFPQLESVGGSLWLSELWALEGISGFAKLDSIGGHLGISFNEELIYIDGFADLDSVGGRFLLEYNDVLADLGDFDDLETIGSVLEIVKNPALVGLTALSDLVSVGGELRIVDNGSLVSLGLPDLVAVGTELHITGNAALSTCDIDALHTRLLANGFAGTTTIEENGACAP